MAEENKYNGLISPLLDQVVVNVNSPASSDQSNDDVAVSASSNPFGYIGCDDLVVPAPDTVDPFRNGTPNIGLYEWIKIVILLPIVALRLILLLLSVVVGYSVTKLSLIGYKDKDKEGPIPKWRCKIMWVTRYCARCIMFSFGYHYIKRKGRPASRETAPIIVANHTTYIEPIFFFYELFPTSVADASHDSMPFIGTIIRAMQVIYVDRFSDSSRKRVAKEIKRRAASENFPRVLIFPEGTTTNGKGLVSFQLGAFYPGHPVQPVVIRYPHVHYDPSWCDVPLGMLIFRMLFQFHNFIEVEYLPVISPSEGNKKNSAHFAKKTSNAIATALNISQTKLTYGDGILHSKAQEANQENPANYMVEMARVEALFRISNKEAVKWLGKFLSMKPDSSGHVKYHDFLRVLKFKSCPLSKQIFSFIDVEKNGTITFRQFIYGLAHILRQPLFREACELAFVECGGLTNGSIVEQQFQNSILAAIPDWKENEVHELFLLFDDDNDGLVSKDDFVACIRRNPLLIAFFLPQLQHKNLLGANEVLDI